jgi:hypothetical protein
VVTGFARSPKVQKGALAVYPSQTPGTQASAVIVFQYNPEQVRRTLADRSPPAPSGKAGAAKQEALRVLGPPVETISLTVELDAADQLEHPDENQVVAEDGLYPALATLELLMYPPSRDAQRLEEEAKKGRVQVSPADLALVLLVWGRSRVMPVDLTSFSVTEEAFDPRLNPIRAKVELGLRVLTYVELPGASVGRDAFISYQKAKEQLAGRHQQSTSDVNGIRTLLPGGQQ